MARRVWPFVAIAVALSALAGCASRERAERPSWRTEAENACLAQNQVIVSAWVQPAVAIEGPGICGLQHPFTVAALAGGTVAFETPQTLDCSMIPALDAWIAEVLQPASQASYGQPVVAIRAFGSYSCRHAQNNPFARYSEHAFGNAIDLASFRLADGREVSVLRDWNGDDLARAFLRTGHGGACGIFTTVLGPGYPQHDNHFHFDLARHGNTSRGSRRYCKPLPQVAPQPQPKRDDLPDPPPLQEDLDVASRNDGSRVAVARAGAAANPRDALPDVSTGDAGQSDTAVASRSPELPPADTDPTASIGDGR